MGNLMRILLKIKTNTNYAKNKTNRRHFLCRCQRQKD